MCYHACLRGSPKKYNDIEPNSHRRDLYLILKSVTQQRVVQRCCFLSFCESNSSTSQQHAHNPHLFNILYAFTKNNMRQMSKRR